MITRPRLIKVLIAGLCAVLFPVIQVPASHAAACSNYSIGYQGPLTGPEAAFGISQLNAVKFALSKYKAANSSSMLSSTIVAADDQGDPALSQNAANSLIDNPCVMAVVGPAFSGASRIALPLYLAAGVPIITPSAINEAINQYGGNIFHRSARLEKEVNLDIMRDVASTSPGATIAYFYDKEGYYLNWMNSGFSGIKISYNAVFAGQRADNAISIKAAYDAGARYFLYDGNRDRQNIQEFAEDVKALSSGNRVIFSSDIDPLMVKSFYTSSLNGSWFYPVSLSFSAINSTLGSEFSTAYPNSDLDYVTEAFDAATFFFQAINSGADTRAKVNTFISTKKMAGLAGNLEFKSNGDRDGYRTPQIVLTGGNLSITDASTLGVNGNYQITDRVSTPNFKLKVIDWNDQVVTTKRHVIFPNYVQTMVSDAVSSMRLPNGDTNIELLPDTDNQDYLQRRVVLKVSVVSGVVTSVIDMTIASSPITYTISDDTFIVKLRGYNFTGTITDAGDFTGALAVISSVSGSTVTGLYKIPITSSNKIFANLDTSKTYRIEIYPSASTYQFNWKSTWDNLSFNGATTLSYSGALQGSNIFGKVATLPSGGAFIKVLRKDSSNNWVESFTRSVASTRDFGFYLAPGTEYKIQAVPSSNDVGPVTTDLLTAPSSGAVTLPNLVFTTPNVTGTLVFENTKFAGKHVYAYRADDDSEAFNGVTDSNGVYKAFLPVGTYNFYADGPSYLHTAGTVKCVVTSTSTSIVCDVPVSKKNVSGQLIFNGSSFRSMVSAYQFMQSGGDSYGTWAEDYSNDDGTYAFDLPRSRVYQFGAKKVLTANSGVETYIPIGFTDKCTVGISPITCNLSLTPNFKVAMTDSLGNPLSSAASISFIVPIIESGVVQERFDEQTWSAENLSLIHI